MRFPPSMAATVRVRWARAEVERTARAGRPLRFLVLVLAGWTGMRAWALWPVDAGAPLLPRAAAADLVPAARPAATRLAAADAIASSVGETSPPTSALRPQPADAQPKPRRPTAPRSPAAFPPLSGLAFGDPVPPPAPGVAPVPAAAAAPGSRPSRLSGSAWLLLRGGPALASGLAGAQLGGSQAGLRLAYAVDDARRLAVVARASSAIGGEPGPGRREAAIGLAWRPTRAAVTLFAEQRFALDSGHGGPTAGVIAGIGPTPVAAGFRLEAYGQAGAIARSGPAGRLEAFGDGAARITRPLALGPLKLDLGAGAWGGAQVGARRLDVGPTLGAAVPVAGKAIRLSFDYRARIAGDARPGSGPALSIGTDF